MADLAVTANVVGIAGGIVSLALAGFVLAASPRAKVNRYLALYLTLLALVGNPALLVPYVDRQWGYNFSLFNVGITTLLPVAYVLFFSYALDTPLVAFLRKRFAERALLALAAVALVHPFVVPYSILRAPTPDEMAVGITWTGTALAQAIVLVAFPLAFGYGLVASLHAWRGAPAGSLARRRAGWYATAFGFVDVTVLLFIVVVVAPLPLATLVLLNTSLSIVLAIFGPALTSYAVLRWQLFDVELRIKRGLSRSVMAALFLAAFFVAAAVAEQYFQQRFGLLAGGLAVGLLLFALRPLERAADRLADAAMPRVQDTSEYRTVRKREVYRAAVEGALADGHISDKERDVLARVAEKLALTPSEMLQIEREAQAANS